MKILLDTQCWLWWFAQPERLNEQAIALMADETNELWFSVASIWEIAIKVANGKLPLPEPIDTYPSSVTLRVLKLKCEKIKTLQMRQNNGCRVTSSQTFGERRTINNESNR